MPYAIHQIEITQPLSAINARRNSEGTAINAETGLAIIVRRNDRPIGFLMREFSSNQTISSDQLADWIAKELGAKIIQEALRQELIDPPDVSGFPSLSVAICTKDQPDNVQRCLKSLLALRSSPLAFDVLIVDNAPSDDRTRRLVETTPDVQYVLEPKPGLNFARNRALHTAQTELIAFLDDGVVVDRQWLNGLKTAWAENPDAAAFTGLVLPYELETPAQILFESRGGFRRGFEKIRYGAVLPGNQYYPCGAGIFGAGCNMAYRRETVLRIGGFDEALDTGAPLPGGDLDMFYRIIRAGEVLVYEPQYAIYHQHRQEWEKLRRQYWTWGLGLMAFVIKSYKNDPHERDRLIGLTAWWFRDQVKQLIKSLLGRHPLPPGMLWAELWGGVVGLLGEYPRSIDRIERIRRQCS